MPEVVKGNLPRGKAKKINKIKDKYAEQDEEERAMRLKLLGVRISFFYCYCFLTFICFRVKK